MKKFALIITLLILIIIATIPYGTGLITAQQLSLFDESVQYLSGFKPTKQAYQRGWFTSSAQSEFSRSSIYHFNLIHKIHHGFQPLTATVIDTTLLSEPLQCTPLSPQIQTTFRSNGETIYSLKSPTCRWKQPQIEINANQGHFSLHRDLSLEKLLSPPPEPDWMDFTHAETELNLAELQLLGSSTVKLSDLQLHGTATRTQETLTLTLASSLSTMNFDGQTLGPGFLELEFRRGYVPMFKEMIDALINQSNLPAYQNQMIFLGILIRHGTALLNHRPELAINRFSVTTHHGQLQGTLYVRTDATVRQLNPLLLLKVFEVEGNMTISRPLLQALVARNSKQLFKKTLTEQDLKQQFDRWLAQGLLIPRKESDDYQIEITMKQGELKINGQTLLR